MAELQVKVMLLVGWRLDVGLATSISSDHINQLISESILLNVGTMKSRASEIRQTVARKRTDLCCLQETIWRASSTRKITGKDCIYKFFWSDDSSGLGVGILLGEQWIDKVL